MLVSGFCLLSHSPIYGVNFFFDDFNGNSIDPKIWEVKYLSIGATLDISNSGVLVNSNDEHVPFVYSKEGINLLPNDVDYDLKVKFKYTDVKANGQGLGIGFINNNGTSVQQAAFWQETAGGLYIYYNDKSRTYGCGDILNYVDNGESRYYKFFGPTTEWHVFEIEKIDNLYSLYLDRDKYSKPYLSFVQTQCAPNRIFFGNLFNGGSWSPLLIDYISVDSYSNLLSPTPSPEPTLIPTLVPTLTPTLIPTPTLLPTETPTPTLTPTLVPTSIPTDSPVKKKDYCNSGYGS